MPVGQVHVEQDQVDLVAGPGSARPRRPTGRRRPARSRPPGRRTSHAPRPPAARPRRRAPARVISARAPSVTVNSAPPRSDRPTVTAPPCRRATWATSARPTPRPPSPDALVVQPRSRRAPRVLGESPSPLSPTTIVGAARHRRRGAPDPAVLAVRPPRRRRCRPGCRARSPGRADGTSHGPAELAVDRQVDAALGGLGRLAEQQRGDAPGRRPRRPPGRRAAGRAGAPRWRTRRPRPAGPSR